MTQRITKFWGAISPYLFAVVVVLHEAGTLVAQEDGAAKGGKKFALSWGLILLCIVLGLLVTLRPTRRTEEVKPVAKDD